MNSITDKPSVIELLENFVKDKTKPLTAMLEIADRCNEACVHCYQLQGQKGELSTDELKAILDELADMGVLFVTFSGGEATLRKDFLELVAYARKLSFAVKLYSNGLKIDRAMADALSDLAVQEVQLSIYSHRPDVHDFVTGVKGSWVKANRAAELLVERGIHVLMKTPLMAGINANYREEYKAYAHSVGADYSFDSHLDAREDGERDPERFRLSAEQLKEVRDAYLDKREDAIRARQPDGMLCGACAGYVHIEANGEMRPCTLLPVDVGHALRDGVKNAWYENKRAKEIRALRWKDIQGCRECDLQPYCHRCFANARDEGGHALRPYRTACQGARAQYERVTGHVLTLEEGETSHTAVITAELSADAVPLGPYRLISPSQIEPFVATLTSQDEEREDAWGWVRKDVAQAPASLKFDAGPGRLVTLRRPGRKPKTEKLPDLQNAEH